MKELLTDWELPPADIHLIYPPRAQLAAKTRALVDFLMARFEPHRDGDGGW